MATKKQQKRELTLLARYYIKKDYAPKGLHAGDIVLYVRNDKGVCYYTYLRRNKAHSCNCRGNAEFGKVCYHILYGKELENARYAASKAVKVVERPALTVVVTPEKVEEPTKPVIEAPKLNVVNITSKSNINGAQQSAAFFAALPSRQKQIA